MDAKGERRIGRGVRERKGEGGREMRGTARLGYCPGTPELLVTPLRDVRTRRTNLVTYRAAVSCRRMP